MGRVDHAHAFAWRKLPASARASKGDWAQSVRDTEMRRLVRAAVSTGAVHPQASNSGLRTRLVHPVESPAVRSTTLTADVSPLRLRLSVPNSEPPTAAARRRRREVQHGATEPRSKTGKWHLVGPGGSEGSGYCPCSPVSWFQNPVTPLGLCARRTPGAARCECLPLFLRLSVLNFEPGGAPPTTRALA